MNSIGCLRHEQQYPVESSHQLPQALHPDWNVSNNHQLLSSINKNQKISHWVTWLALRVLMIDLICSVMCSSSISINSACSYLNSEDKKLVDHIEKVVNVLPFTFKHIKRWHDTELPIKQLQQESASQWFKSSSQNKTAYCSNNYHQYIFSENNIVFKGWWCKYIEIMITKYYNLRL